MNIDAKKFGLASAGAFALLWLLCSLVVWGLPALSMDMSGHMLHSDLSHMRWSLSLTGVLLGGLIWSSTAGLTGWLIAWLYNAQQ